MDDIVTQLREHAHEEKKVGNDLLHDVLYKAANEIERLSDKNTTLKIELNHWKHVVHLFINALRTDHTDTVQAVNNQELTKALHEWRTLNNYIKKPQ